MLKNNKLRKFLSLVLLFALVVIPCSTSGLVYAGSNSYEAENAVLSGGTAIEREHYGYSGSGYVGGFVDGNKGNAAVQFSVNVSASGSYDLTTRYANGNNTMTLSLFTDGQFTKQLSLPSTGNWSSWNTTKETIQLNAGNHTIKYIFQSSDSGNINLDNMTLELKQESGGGTGESNTTTTLYAHNAILSGGTVLDTEHSGYSGSGFIGGFTDSARGNASAKYTGNIGNIEGVKIRYANGTGTKRTLTLFVDNTLHTQVNFPSTTAWNTWGTVDIPVNLTSGTHSFEIKYTANDNGNVNLDCIQLLESFGGGTTEPTPEDPDPTPGDNAGNGLFHIKNQWQGTYLYEDSGNVYYGALESGNPAYSWAIEESSSGYTLWNGETGNYITTQYISDSNSMLSASREESDGIYFTLQESSAGYYSIKSKTNSNWLINIENLKGYAQCYNNAQPGWGSSSWKLEYVSTVPVRPDAPDPIEDNYDPDLSGVGADLPFITYEAEDGNTNGQILEKNTQYYQVQSEASERKAVKLNNTGDYVEFELTEPANSIVVRYSIPDSADGKGINASIGIYADNQKIQDIALSSKFSWVYGEYPWSNNPSEGKAHRFFDESRAFLQTGTLPAGTTIRLQKEANSNTSYCILDLIDMELVAAPIARPANMLSITEYGAVAGDGISDTQAFVDTIAAAKAQNKGVWIPEGTFELLTGPISVDNVTIRGAGMWYSTLSGVGASFALSGSNCKFYDFAMYGDTTRRIDSAPETGFDGNAGTGSVIQNIWVEHLKCGVWVNSPTNGLVISGSRFRNTFADGVNLCAGTKNSILEHSHFRNTGDDSIAVWSAQWISSIPSQNNVVRNNTVQSNWLANGIAVYGGANNLIENNLVRDTVAFGAGINVSSNFDPADFSGTTTVRNNTLIRTGSREWNLGYNRGAIWVFSASKPITAKLDFYDNKIYDSTYQAILIEGEYNIPDLNFTDIVIEGTGTNGIHVRGKVAGTARFTNVTINNNKQTAYVNESPNFNVIKGEGCNW